MIFQSDLGSDLRSDSKFKFEILLNQTEGQPTQVDLKKLKSSFSTLNIEIKIRYNLSHFSLLCNIPIL